MNLSWQPLQRMFSACGAVLISMAFAIAPASDAQTVEYIHTDALGTPVAVTDAAKNVIERSEYSPYGDLLNRADKDGPGYTGHVQDAATGLIYMQQRYYDPLGVFLSVDAVTAYEQPVTNFCRYCYALNNPYKFVDLDGRQSRDFEIISKTSGAFENRKRPTPEEREKDWLGPAIGVALGGMLAAPVAGFAGPGAVGVAADLSMGDALGGASLAPATALGSLTVQTLARDGNTVELVVSGAKGGFTVITDVAKSGKDLVLSGLHIGGEGKGASSLSELRNAARVLGQQEGAERVVIQGGQRTTGANPGKKPIDIIIEVNK